MINWIKYNQNKIAGGILLFLVAGNFIVWGEVLKKEREPDLAVYFFDVGQGDAAFITARDGTQILIDGGPNSQILSLLGSAMPYYDGSIDVIILSHPHRDHLAGLIDVLGKYEIGMIVESGVAYESSEYKEFAKAAAAEEAERVIVDSLSRLLFAGGAELKFIYPRVHLAGKSVKNVNEASLVALLDYQDVKVLFTGDIGAVTEEKLLAAGVLDDIDALKVGHQGSKYSSSLKFLNKILPEYAIVSVGRNSYGHPHPDALSRLASVGAKLFRTDADGTIKLEIHSGELKIQLGAVR